MTEAVPLSIVKRRNSTPNSPPLAVKKYEGLSLEPPTKDVVEVGDDGDTEAVTKEEEWITKRKTELITKRQIETRVKRQVLLEDGKVVEDSGPIVSTNTTEDTEKQETESTERRNLGNPDVVDGPGSAIEYRNDGDGNELTTSNEAGKMVHTLVARPDGLVRETNDKRVVSREVVQERLETEDVRHLGDFSDEAYVNAVNSGIENLEEVLYSPEHQRQLVPLGPRIVHQSTKAHKTIDTEDIEEKYLAKPDGTLVTEKKKTTEHEELFDEDLPDNDNDGDKKSTLGSQEKINQTESSQRYYKQRDEQNVEYVADGKVIGKEMRYVAETEQMERDGPPESPGDWDSLSDRIRKARRTQKTLLQQQKEAAVLADRKDALTKRPLDFDREEETRKGETIKWLESHFGSESTSSSSSSSREGSGGEIGQNIEIEPTKKTFFNVTIKSNQTKSPTTVISPVIHGSGTKTAIPNGRGGINDSLSSPSKVIMPDRETAAVVINGSGPKTKYFQGISNWSERKESAPRHFSSKAFRDELEGTIANNHLRRKISREDIRYPTKIGNDDYVRKEDIIQQKHAKYLNNYNSRNVNISRYRKDSKEDSDDSRNNKIQKEDLGYLSGSRTDLRYRRDSTDEIDRSLPNRTTNGYLKREDSGYVKDSREDIRSSLIRDGDEDRDKYRSSLIQRDDSAYVSSSTYFTDTRLPKTPLRTPDSGIRSPSPDIFDPEITSRPSVPQRKRAIEKKLRQHNNNNNYSPPSPILAQQHEHDEPPPDYSPPPRSRSISPIHVSPTTNNHIEPITNGITSRKQNQRTRFASESSSASNNNNNHRHHNSHNHHNHNHHHRPTTVATQTIETQTSPPPKQSTKVGQAIGNSLRKLVGKIRSASAERKLRMKSKSKSRDRSPSPPIHPLTPPVNGSTYQQYNVIDSHISGQPILSRQQSHQQQQQQQQQQHNQHQPQHHQNHQNQHQNQQQQQQQQHLQNSTAINRDSSVVSSSTTAGLPERDRDRERERRGSSDIDMMSSPKQRYYLGEDPYGGSIFGKENKYDGISRPSQYQQHPAPRTRRQNGGEEREFVQRNVTSSTLGRYNKTNTRLGSTPNLDNHDYRNSQTLPRKLERPNHHSSTINVSILNPIKQQQKHPVQNTGPAKPARTYKSLNRSKSFNVHAMNGTNDPSPIYIEKLTKNHNNHNHHSSHNGTSHIIYKSNPHLHESGPQLKSPSIVNLISRSQRDLTRIDETDHHNHHHYQNNQNHHYTNGNNIGSRKYSSNYSTGGTGLNGGNVERRYSNKTDYNSNSNTKKNLFLKDLQNKAPDLYKTLHGDEDTSTNQTIRNGFNTNNTNNNNNNSNPSSHAHSHHHQNKKYSNIITRERESSSMGSRSPIEINKDTASIIRRGSSSTEDYSETYRITTKSDDPRRPSVTNTIQSFTKKTIPSKDGRGFETIQSSERKSITKSRYNGEPMSNIKYMEESVKHGTGGGPVVIEVRSNTNRK